MEQSRSFKNTTSSARDRVVGTGPDRKLLPASKKLLDIPDDIVVELNQFFESHRAINDLSVPSKYGVSTHCPLRHALPNGFQHILLTRLKSAGDARNEQDYTEVTKEALSLRFISWLEQYFPNAFRVRLSLLKSGTEFGWHIDTNTSVACRCSVTLNQNSAKFEVKMRNQIYQVPMQVGEVHFTNTGWPHRVYNEGDMDRLNLVFGVPFSDIESFFSKNEDRYL